MTTRTEPNHLVMLNLFQHLVCFFLPSADPSFRMNIGIFNPRLDKDGSIARQLVKTLLQGLAP
jgi:hypothetical protein